MGRNDVSGLARGFAEEPILSPATHRALCAVLLVALAPPPLTAHDGWGVDLSAEPQAFVVRVHSRSFQELEPWLDRIDLWTYSRREGFGLAAIDPETYGELLASGLTVEVDLERTLELRRPLVELTGAERSIPGFSCYRTVEETYQALQALATDHPTLAQWSDFGDSWEKINGPGAGYDLRVLVLSNQASSAPKFPFILIAAIHARELATAELATRFAEQLVNGYGSNPDSTWLLDHAEIHLVAQLNPDGRKKAESGLSWRKNVDNAFCANTNSRGVDLNRNSSFLFGGTGSSSSQCSEIFRGLSAASEPEVASIETYMSTVFQDQRGPAMSDAAPASTEGLFISLHSFGGYVLFPWEGVSTVSPNNTGLGTLARKFGFFTGYEACQEGLPPAAGTTVDEAYGEYGVAAYTFEIGNSFFESCSSFENTVMPANLPALLYGAKAARRPYQDSAGPEILSLTLSSGSVPAGTAVGVLAVANQTRYANNGCGAAEPSRTVSGAGYSIDIPPWDAGVGTSLSAADGMFNGTVENLTGSIDTTALSEGRHIVFVFGLDSSGNRGVPTAAFLDITVAADIFSDGFESGDTAAWSATVP